MISKETQDYIDLVSKMDLCEMSLDSLKLEFSNNTEINNVLDSIKEISNNEIILSRKEIVHEYGCITEYLQLIEDIKSEHYEDGTEAADQADSAIEDFAHSISDLFTDIENKSLALETHINAIEFCNAISNHLSIKDEINKEVSDKLESIIN